MDIFRTLTGSTRFDKTKFKNDFKPFQSRSSKATDLNLGKGDEVPQELDFFNTSSLSATASTSSTKRAASTTTMAEEEEGLDRATLKKMRKEKRKQAEAEKEAALSFDEPAFLRQHKIKYTGDDVPSPIISMSSLPVTPSTSLLLANWDKRLGLKEPTSIQLASWSIILQNRDLLACSPTGSGKTLAFLLPLLLLASTYPSNAPTTPTPSSSGISKTLNKKKSRSSSSSSTPAPKQTTTRMKIEPKILILEPTRELSMQVFRTARSLIHRDPSEDGSGIGVKDQLRVEVLGENGVGVLVSKKKKKEGKKGKKEKEVVEEASGSDSDEGSEKDDEIEAKGSIDVLITTPLRLIYAIKANLVSLSSTRHLVLDEADKLLELNFLSQTDELLSQLPSESIQKSMFSATLPSTVEELAKSVMKPSLIRTIIGQKDSASSIIKQELLFVGNEDHKLLSLRTLISQGQFTPPVLIFVQSILRAKELASELVLDGINSDTIHADRTSEERDQVVRDFAEGKIWCLISTDVLGRGIDFKGVKLVINYDFPQSAGSYIHRIGRTGRAGKEGKAITFFTKSDAPYLKMIVNVLRQSGCPVPEYMLSLKAPTQDDKKKLKMKPIERKDISFTNGSSGNRDKKDRKGSKRKRVMPSSEGVFKKRKEGVDVEE